MSPVGQPQAVLLNSGSTSSRVRLGTQKMVQNQVKIGGNERIVEFCSRVHGQGLTDQSSAFLKCRTLKSCSATKEEKISGRSRNLTRMIQTKERWSWQVFCSFHIIHNNFFISSSIQPTMAFPFFPSLLACNITVGLVVGTLASTDLLSFCPILLFSIASAQSYRFIASLFAVLQLFLLFTYLNCKFLSLFIRC